MRWIEKILQGESDQTSRVIDGINDKTDEDQLQMDDFLQESKGQKPEGFFN